MLLCTRTDFVMNRFLGKWESNLWTYLFLYSPLAKLLYFIWIVVTVFPTLWLVCVVCSLILAKQFDEELWISTDDLGLSPTMKFLPTLNCDQWEQSIYPQSQSQKTGGRGPSNTVGLLEEQHVSVCGLEIPTFPQYSALLWETMFVVIPSDPSPLGLSQ